MAFVSTTMKNYLAFFTTFNLDKLNAYLELMRMHREAKRRGEEEEERILKIYNQEETRRTDN